VSEIILPGQNQPGLPDQKPIYARSGWKIPCESAPVETEARIRIRAGAIMNEMLPGRLDLRSVSAYGYNCVGMIFAARRAYIEIDHIYDILRADGYHPITKEMCVVGDVVLYRDHEGPSHVSLVTRVEIIGQERSIRVLSKWGMDAEFEHWMHDVVKRLGRPVEFYTERKI
jgi:hypothetical protein